MSLESSKKLRDNLSLRDQVNVMAKMYEDARASGAKIIIADGWDKRAITAAKVLKRTNLVKDVLLLNEHSFAQFSPAQREELVQVMRDANIRGIYTDDNIRKHLAEDTKYLAAAMVKAGQADGFVAGNVCSTGDTIRPALQVIKTNEFASSFFIMSKDNTPLLFADCAFNIKPDAEQLAQIGINTAIKARELGIKTPRIAFLSFATHNSAKHPEVDKVREAVERAKEIAQERGIDQDVEIDGPLQFDAAFDKTTGDSKAPGSSVAGKANIFIFPDLKSGNIGYKIAQRLGDWNAMGPVFVGFNKPVHDLSRGCSWKDIVHMVVAAAAEKYNKSA